MYYDIDKEVLTNIVVENNKVNLQHYVYDLLHDVKEDKVCRNKSCRNIVKFSGSFVNGYRKFCSVKCSKNKDELKHINLFNGVHKIREKPHNEKTLYFKKCREITRLTYRQNKSIINPNDCRLGKAGVEGAYQIDHIISVHYGFENNIAPEIIGGLENLRVVPWRVNSVKNKYLTNYEEDFEYILSSYEKKEYTTELNVHDFIEKFCINKSGRVNTKINEEWFVRRKVEKKLNEIKSLTDYLENENIPFRIFSIHFHLYKNKIKPSGNRNIFMRRLLNPTIDYIDLSGDDEQDFKKAFLCFDKRLNRYRLKSNSYDWMTTINKQGILFLYYKYFDKLRNEYNLNT
jgi:hypothetical protein